MYVFHMYLYVHLFFKTNSTNSYLHTTGRQHTMFSHQACLLRPPSLSPNKTADPTQLRDVAHFAFQPAKIPRCKTTTHPVRTTPAVPC